MDGNSPEIYQDPTTGATEASFSEEKKLSGLTNLPQEKIQQYQSEMGIEEKPLPFDSSETKKTPTKEEQEDVIKKTFEEAGETAAISIGVSMLEERIQKKTGISDEQMKALMETDASEGLQKLFEEKVKKELREQGLIPKTDNEMKDEDWNKVQTLTQLRAQEYNNSSLKDITGEFIENIYNSVDFETFLWAILGKDVGNGRYGQRAESIPQKEKITDPTMFILDQFQRNPQFQAEYLTRGFSACKDKTVIEELKALAQDPYNEAARTKVLDHIKNTVAKDPQQCQRFIWGMYVAFGMPAEGAQISPDVAMAAVRALTESKLSRNAPAIEAKQAA